MNSTWFNQGWWESGISYASYLKELGDNTKLTLHFKAALGTGITEANAIIFPVVEYTVKSKPLPIDYTNFDNKNMNGWTRGPKGLYLTMTTNSNGYHLWSGNGQIPGDGISLYKSVALVGGTTYLFEASLNGNYYHSPSGAYLVAGNQRSPTQWFTNENKILAFRFTASTTGSTQISVNTIATSAGYQQITILWLRVTKA